MITGELANFAGNIEINGNRGDISVDEAVVDADREEWRCSRIGTDRDAQSRDGARPEKLLLILAEGGDEFAVLTLGADGDAEAVLTELHTGAISDDDALIHKEVVDAGSVAHLCQEEVGLCGIYLFADGQFGKGLHHAGTLL